VTDVLGKPPFDFENRTKEVASRHVVKMLIALGVNLRTKHTEGTPDRIAQMYMDFFDEGRNYFKFTVFPWVGEDMIVETNITFYSLCAHHFLPFFGSVDIAYIPNGKMAGLSKLARTVVKFSHRPQVQEILTKQIADFLVEKLETQHVAVLTRAEHLCMSMRGVKSPGHLTVIPALRGNFLELSATREEFYRIVGMSR